MIVDILLSFLLQIALTLGVILLYGFLIALCNKAFYANFGSKSKIVCYVTGFIGTPIHELSHALFCLLFGHKITEIKLFQINSDDGTLGYVSHSYNKKNFYHRIGSFFIGIAPIIVISSVLYLISLWLLPNMMNLIAQDFQNISFSGGFKSISKAFSNIFSVLLNYSGNVNFWIFIVIGIFLALHMTLSGADIKNALGGLAFVLLIMLLLNIVFYFFNASAIYNFAILNIAAILNMILFLSFIISVIAVIISFTLKFTIGRKIF